MKSGLEDRNNHAELIPGPRPADRVSMKSGLEDRNNLFIGAEEEAAKLCLNEVRPGRPEQLPGEGRRFAAVWRLNEVRPGRPEQ